MKTKTHLLPCPFCGRRASMIHIRLGKSSPWRWYVSCSHQQKCGIRVMTWDYDTEAEAAAAWNRRAAT